jgi:hypothetical protein
MITRFCFVAISCRRLIDDVAAVTYMQCYTKSKATMRRAGPARDPEVNDGME